MPLWGTERLNNLKKVIRLVSWRTWTQFSNLAPLRLFLTTIIGIATTYRLQSNRKRKLQEEEWNWMKENNLKKIAWKEREEATQGKVFLSSFQFLIPLWEVWRSQAKSKFHQIMAYSTKDFNLVKSKNSRKPYARKQSFPRVPGQTRESIPKKTDHKAAGDQLIPFWPPPPPCLLCQSNSSPWSDCHHGLASRECSNMQEDNREAFPASFQK